MSHDAPYFPAPPAHFQPTPPSPTPARPASPPSPVAHGKVVTSNPDGSLASKCTYVHGDKHGEEETFDAQGKPTFKGEWHYGHPIGEHVEWNDGEETRTRFERGVPVEVIENTKLRDKIVKKIKKGKDSYAKSDALDDIDYSYRNAYVVHLWRTKQLDVAGDPDLWEMLAEAHALLSGDDLVTFLSKVPTKKLDGDILPAWPARLDAIVMNVYARDPKPIDKLAKAKDLAKPLRAGLALVRARFGVDETAVLGKLMAALVKQHIEHYGLDRVLWPVDGVVSEVALRSDYNGTKTEYFDKLIALFGSKDAWIAELRKAMLKKASDGISFPIFRDLLECATEEDLVIAVDGISLDSDIHEKLHRALTEWRKADAATITRIALSMKETGLHKWPVVSTAILEHARSGAAIPDALADALELATESPTYTSAWWNDAIRALPSERQHEPYLRLASLGTEVGFAVPRTKLLRDAFDALSDAQARRVIDRSLGDKYQIRNATQFLYRIDDPEVWKRAAAAVEGNDTTAMYGLGELGARALPMLVEHDGFGMAVLVAIARALADGDDVDASYDARVTFDLVEDMYWKSFAPFYWRIIAKLPPPRAEAILVRGLGAKDANGFSYAFSLIGFCPTPAVISAAFAALRAREAKLTSSQIDRVCDGIAGLPEREQYITWMLRSGLGGGLGDTLKRAIGWALYEKLEEALGDDKPKTIDDVEKLKNLADDLGGGSERVYVLRRFDYDYEPTEAILATRNRIGGPAPGVGADRWPTYDDEPMAHLFTLDLETMPTLAKVAPPDTRCISVFCWSPDNNEAYESGTSETAVVFTTAAQLAQQVSPPEEAVMRSERYFEPVAIDVDPSVWSDRDSDLRKSLYQAHGRVLGQPLWLQSDEGGIGEFVMQFDESFCQMNLGDMGVMYVFSDDAFWQCH